MFPVQDSIARSRKDRELELELEPCVVKKYMLLYLQRELEVYLAIRNCNWWAAITESFMAGARGITKMIIITIIITIIINIIINIIITASAAIASCNWSWEFKLIPLIFFNMHMG